MSFTVKSWGSTENQKERCLSLTLSALLRKGGVWCNMRVKGCLIRADNRGFLYFELRIQALTNRPDAPTGVVRPVLFALSLERSLTF
jgi:hypothetical protein